MSEQTPKFHKWFHQFLINFALWAYAAIAVIFGAREIIFAVENRVSYEVIVIILGIVLIGLGLFTVKVRFDLAAFRPSAPKELLGVCLAAAAVVALIHFLLVIPGSDDNSSRLTTAFILVCWGIALYRYYHDRPYLFQ